MAWVNIADVIYPIGSIYETTSSVSPSELFGGTWNLIDDVFLLGAGNSYSVKTTGGEANHTLTINEMPSHSHPGPTAWVDNSGQTISGYHIMYRDSGSSGWIESSYPFNSYKNGGGHHTTICHPIMQFIYGKGRRKWLG